MTIDLQAEQDSITGTWETIGLDASTVELVSWSSSLTACFDEESARVANACGDRLAMIEHVGSTSVPGLDSRPIIDLLVGVEHLRDASECIEPLKGIGYKCHGENGVAGRRHFTRSIDRRCVVQLHMVQIDGEFWSNAIRFRDLLRSDSQLADEYVQAKKELQVRFATEPSAYEEARAAFERSALG